MSAARTLPFRGTRFGSPGAGSLSLGIPAAAYPGRVATNSDLIVAVDQQQTTLLLPMGVSDLTATVLDPSSIKAFNLLSIDSEIVKTLGPPAGNVIPVSRGFDGTLPAGHVAGAIVAGFIDAYHHNALVAEVEAIETFLGPNGINIPSSSLLQGAIPFAPQQPGGSLVVGSNAIIMTPVPKGVNGTDVGHYLWVSGGTGTAEAALITGGSGKAGDPSGQIIIQCANTHSGAWTIQTATAGIQEAEVASNGGMVFLAPGTYNIFAPISISTAGSLCGASRSGVTITGNNPTQDLIDITSTSSVHITSLTLSSAAAKTGGCAIVVSGATTGSEIDNVAFINQYNVVSILQGVAISIHDTYAGNIAANGLIINNNFVDAGDSTFYANVWDGSGSTGAGVLWSSGGGLRITNNKFLGWQYAIDVNAGNNVRTSDFQIVDNSIENFTAAVCAIRVQSTGSNSLLQNVLIMANQIAYVGICIEILEPVQQVIVADNFLQSIGNGVTCVRLSTGLAQIYGNRIGSGSSGSVGVDLTGIQDRAFLIENFMLNVTTPYILDNSGLAMIQDHVNALPFAQLPILAANGSTVYCSNGTTANPVAGGGTGCIAKKLNGVWVGN